MSPEERLDAYLARFRKRLRLRDGWLLLQRTLWIALLAALLILLAGRIWPIEGWQWWTLAPVGAWLVLVLVVALLRPLSAMRVAFRVDAELGLKERLSTSLALERPTQADSSQAAAYAAFQPELVEKQHADALARASAIEPARAFPLQVLRRPLALAAVLALAIAAAVWLPNPMERVLAERAAIAQVAEQQAQRVEELRQEIEEAQELTPEQRDEILRKLKELSEKLRANPGDLEDALAELSRVEESLRERLDPRAGARQAALESLAAQLQSLADPQSARNEGDLSEAAQALEKLAEQLQDMSDQERQEVAQNLAQMAARAAQAGDGQLAQALAQMSQAAQSGEFSDAGQAAQAASDALQQAQGELADQQALQRALSQLQASSQAMAQAGNMGRTTAQNMSSGQGQGQPGQGNNPGQGQGQSQGQGQGQPGGGGGTRANTLPPARRSGRAGDPQGPGQSAPEGQLDQQVYVPWERLQGDGEMFIPGQDTGQGETQVREQQDPLPGAVAPSLVPYREVYYDYLDSANQAMDQSYIPSGLEAYVRDYFSQLEP